MSEREKVAQQYSTNANLRARIALHDRFSRTTVSYPHWIFDGYAFGDDADVLEVGCGMRTSGGRTSTASHRVGVSR